MLARPSRRTIILGAVAFVLVGATAYDYTVGIGPRRDTAAIESHLPAEPAAGRSRVSDLAREAVELKHYLTHAREIRGRYQAIAVPYAEAVATFVTLYAPGESPQAVVRKRIPGLLPPDVELKGLLASEVNATDRGAIWLTADINFSSADSAAFERAVLTLGDPANGTLWKELSVAGDSETHTLRASGKLLILMVEQSE